MEFYDLTKYRPTKSLFAVILFVWLVWVICVWYWNLHNGITLRYGVPLYKQKSDFVTTFSNSTVSYAVHYKPKILFWTGFFGSKNHWETFFRESFAETETACPRKCTFSIDNGDLMNSDMVIFNSRDLSDWNSTLPSYRHMNQTWLLHNTEPPSLTYLNYKFYNGVFNWTSSTRHDSDVPTFYGKFIKRSTPTSSNYIKPLSRKSKMVAWMASNCITKSNREWYVRRLKQYIPVDRYGKCGELACPKHSSQCEQMLQEYIFYLAFENSISRDYVTEKFWRAMKLGLIPVVMSGHNAHKKIAPEDSYIDYRSYSTPADLASYLHTVANNETLYRSYFAWNRKWIIGGSYFCDLCEAVWQDREAQTYHDLDGWLRQDTCSPYSMWDEIPHYWNFFLYYILYYISLW